MKRKKSEPYPLEALREPYRTQARAQLYSATVATPTGTLGDLREGDMFTTPGGNKITVKKHMEKPCAAPPKRRQHPEQDLQRAIWKLYQARYSDIFLMFHAANGEKRSPKTAGILKTMGVVPGVPDFVGCLWGGTFFGLEVKTDKGRLSEHQQVMKDRISAFRGEWDIIRSVEEFERWAELEQAAMIAMECENGNAEGVAALIAAESERGE